MTAQVSEFRIVRRAFGETVHVATIRSTWVEACNFAHGLTFAQRDGEYFERRAGEPDQGVAAPYSDLDNIF